MVGLIMRCSELYVSQDPFETMLDVAGYLIVNGKYLRLGLVLLVGTEL